MSLLFDQNLSRRLPALLAAEFPGSEQVIGAGLATADDRAVWAYATAHGLAVVSKDADFAQLSAALGPPPKVIWLRIGNGRPGTWWRCFGRGQPMSRRSWPIPLRRCWSCRSDSLPVGSGRTPPNPHIWPSVARGRITDGD